MTTSNVRDLASAARAASYLVAAAVADQRAAALSAIADALANDEAAIIRANAADVDAATRAGMAAAMIDRLRLTPPRLAVMIRAVRDIAAAPEVVGDVATTSVRPNGLQVQRIRIPLGVVAMIYEARPNVTTDAAALCLKAGNACILRGGSEAFGTNQALGHAIARGLAQAGLPTTAVQLVPTTDRATLLALLGCDDLIDVVIPRGGEGLIRAVTEASRIPVIRHYKGVCHVYVHRDADLAMARAICVNAKAQRPTVCNACETILVDAARATEAVPILVEALEAAGVEIRACEHARRIVPRLASATEADWQAEYLAPIVALRVVADLAAAKAHIARYGSNHTEAIVTNSLAAATEFLRDVNSSTVLHNASTRFADGAELGLGAEIGISTSKLHAYGPMGAEGLTTLKWVVRGTGHIRE